MLEQPEILPQIRQDLAIEKAGAGWNGEPSWLIHDPLQNRFFRISDKTMRLLSIWQAIEIEQFVVENIAEVTKEEVLELAEFLYANSLSTTPINGDYINLYGRSLAGKKSWWQTIVHSYLFFRIPLARPQPFLDFAWPYVSFLFTRRAVIILATMAVIGLYLVSRQWSQFLTTFASFLSFDGLMLYAVSLVLIKTLHELGHAFMAKRYNVEVPTIGAAFIVMMPILYTDTSGAWRLQDRKQRLMIDFAGIFTELALAAICTLAWVFLPDGNLRAIAFTTATLSWILSLTINLNPFMKFDGYYILSDALGFENLQARGFATAKWWLREKLFGIGKPVPEHLSTGMRKFVIVHAFGVWIYRFFLFLGIALLVYHFFFKVLGVIMFIIELVWFIAMPITNEIKEWWKMRDEIKQNSRYRWSMAILMLGFFALAYPFSTSVQVPAILGQKQEIVLHAPFPAKILDVKMREDMQVEKGQLLLRLGSDELNQKIANVRLELKSIKTRLARAHADKEDRSQFQVLNRQTHAISQKLNGLNAKLENLEIRAPHDGLLVDPQPNLHAGRWIDEKLRIAMVRSVNQPQIKALADENSRVRISNGATGTFFPDDFQLPAIDVKLIAMANVSGTGNELVYLSEMAGSMVSINTEANPKTNNGLEARKAWFALRFKPIDMVASPDMVLRGVIVLDAEPVSMLSRIMRQVASVLVREAGI